MRWRASTAVGLSLVLRVWFLKRWFESRFSTLPVVWNVGALTSLDLDIYLVRLILWQVCLFLPSPFLAALSA